MGAPFGEQTGAQGFESLDTDIRRRLCSALGVDLSAMRVHTDLAAERVAEWMGADAVTYGRDVWFAAGEFRPDTDVGLGLLAHEATHVLQQAAHARAGHPHVSVAQQRRWERQARDVGAALATGRTVDRRLVPDVSGAEVAAVEGGLVQRHVSFEHRVLGDLTTFDLVAISTGAPGRAGILAQQLQLLSAFRTSPLSVDEQDVANYCPWIRTIRLGPDQVLATYGEVNALPDYLANLEALESLGRSILLPILQVIRQEGFNQLTFLLTGTNPYVMFAEAACAPWSLSFVNDIVETQALDVLTAGLGHNGSDHYQGLLARNACHFAPYSWYRWQAAHLIARDLAEAANRASGPLAEQLEVAAWSANGYADHFLQDSFAAGHLLNKTLVMQWFIEWAAGQTYLPVPDWGVLQTMTTTRQPRIAAAELYVPGCLGPSTDPQTVAELRTIGARIAGSQVVADGPADVAASYQGYLTFLSSTVTQLATANVHDHFNAVSAWVASNAQPVAYEVWGDATLLSGPNGGDGVGATSNAAQQSQAAIAALVQDGVTSITPQQIQDCFPTLAGISQDTVTDLATFNASLKPLAEGIFDNAKPVLKALLAGFGSPRLGVSSQDQNLGERWYASLAPTVGTKWFTPVETLTVAGRVFTGNNGYVLELDPASGDVLQSALLTSSVGVLDYTTRLATDGRNLFVGVHGYVYGRSLDALGTDLWPEISVGGTLSYTSVHVLYDVGSGALYAGSNGSVYAIDPRSGRVTSSSQLVSSFGVGGDYTTHLLVSGSTLFAGVHGYVYARKVQSLGKSVFSAVGVGGWGVFDPVTLCICGTSLVAGSNGYVYAIDQSSGAVQQQAQVLANPSDVHTTVAADATQVYVGICGAVYARPAGALGTSQWSTNNIGGRTGADDPVHVVAVDNRVLAGCNGYVSDLDAATGTVRGTILPAMSLGVGNYETRLSTTGEQLYAGSHGYAYALNLQAATPPAPVGGSALVCTAQRALHLPVVDQYGGLWHSMCTDGQTWSSPVGNIRQVIVDEGFADIGPATAVAAAAFVDGSLNVLATDASGRLWHTIRHLDGSWDAWGDVRGVIVGEGHPDIAAVVAHSAATSSDDGLHVLVLDADGDVWHTLRGADGSWTAWLDVRAATIAAGGQDVGPVTLPAVAYDATGNLHVLLTAATGRLWHAICTPSGVWSPLGDVRAVIAGGGNPDVGLVRTATAACQVTSSSQPPLPLHVVVTDNQDTAWWTERNPDGSWAAWTDIPAAAAAWNALGPRPAGTPSASLSIWPGEIDVVNLVDTSGQQWRTSRPPGGSWGGWATGM